MKALLAGIGVATVFTLAGCGGHTTPAPTVTVTAAAPAPVASPDTIVSSSAPALSAKDKERLAVVAWYKATGKADLHQLLSDPNAVSIATKHLDVVGINVGCRLLGADAQAFRNDPQPPDPALARALDSALKQYIAGATDCVNGTRGASSIEGIDPGDISAAGEHFAAGSHYIDVATGAIKALAR